MTEQKFTSGRGGARAGAGRPQKEKTVIYFRRVKPEWVKKLDEILELLKAENKELYKRIIYEQKANKAFIMEYQKECAWNEKYRKALEEIKALNLFSLNNSREKIALINEIVSRIEKSEATNEKG